ncbi:hypothetical protein D9756_011151 [Leucocoprinus leucothites]|uniref:F-box domain-containing protein n=1 Tax=Leucocoprinus leucothites TaxID=201217 RepID=A0A8H5CNK1_9AGAR|nr:hypothetical protein D9756_011151 [Leucoagaricus leucothites]
MLRLPNEVLLHILRLCDKETVSNWRLVSASFNEAATAHSFALWPSVLPETRSYSTQHPAPKLVCHLKLRTRPPILQNTKEIGQTILSFPNLNTITIAAPDTLQLDFATPASPLKRIQAESGVIPALQAMSESGSTVPGLRTLVFQGTLCLPFLAVHAHLLTKLEIIRVGELVDHYYGPDLARIHLPRLDTLSIDDIGIRAYSYLADLELYTAPMLRTLNLRYHSCSLQTRSMAIATTTGTILDKAQITKLSIAYASPACVDLAQLYRHVIECTATYPNARELHVHIALDPLHLQLAIDRLNGLLSSTSSTVTRASFHLHTLGHNAPAVAAPALGSFPIDIEILVTSPSRQLLEVQQSRDRLD